MIPYLLVFVGGGAGAVARYAGGVLWGRHVGRLIGHAYGFGATFLINVLGGFLMGALISALALRGGADQEKWRLLLGVGVLGGFTTFSSFSLEAVMLIQKKDYGTAGAYIGGSVLFSLLGVMAGLYLTRKVLA
jgi:CrcB protein